MLQQPVSEPTMSLQANAEEPWPTTLRFSYPKSPHERTIEEIFGEGAVVPDSEAPFSCVVVAFVNRSGSNYLAQLLKSTGAFCGFSECLNAPTIRFLAPRYGASSFSEYLKRHRTEDTRGQNRAWGLKAGWMQLAMLYRLRAIPYLLTPTIVFVRRLDLISQAVSLYIAEQTAQWTTLDKLSRPRGEVPYDGARILGHYRSIVESYGRLEQITTLCGLPTHHVVYEDLLSNANVVVANLTGALTGRKLSPTPDDVRISIQRDGLNCEFRDRFLGDLQTLEWHGQ